VPYLAKRLALFVPVVLLATGMAFLLMRVVPGDPALVILAGPSGDGAFKAEDLAKLRQELGTDRPLHTQYLAWLARIARGDLGTALVYRTRITAELLPRLAPTLELAFLAVTVSLVLAVPFGLISAVKRDTPIDYAARAIAFAGISVPIFVTGLVVVYLLVRLFGWFPPLGYASLWEDPWTNLQQMVFPTLSLAFFELNFTARLTRSAVLEVLHEDYVRTARSKGLHEISVILVHVLRNAFLPIVTVSGWSLARLLGGTVVVEKIFLVPGLGTLLLDSITARDYPLTQAIVLVFALVVLTVNLLIDLMYAWLDPRIRYA
jgi:peptide/nickel transport system permease protein